MSRPAIPAFFVLTATLAIVIALLISPSRSGAEAAPCEVTPRLDELSAQQFDSAKAWMDAHQKGFVAVETALDASVANDSAGTLARLKQGVIGVALDPVNEQLRVVIDPDVINQTWLQTLVSSAVASVIGEPRLSVTVQPGCNSAAAVSRAYDTITTRNESKSASSPAMTAAIDPWTSTARAGVPEQDAESHAYFEGVDDSALSVDTVPGVQSWEGGRFNDASPHWGGAAIYDRNRFTSNNCTSAFTAVLPSGEKGGVTAGHCVRNDHTIKSGSEHYGVAAEVLSSPSSFDMARIKNDGDVFNRRIYSAPGTPSNRGVESAGDPSVGEAVCQSGMRSGQTCEIYVINNSTDFGSTKNTALGFRAGYAGGAGDSGGPVYVRNGTLARIRGMVLGGPGQTSPYMYFHKVETIKNRLGVSQIGGP